MNYKQEKFNKGFTPLPIIRCLLTHIRTSLKRRQVFYRNIKSSLVEGFTLVEVMVAMAIFTVVIIVGIGAILDATTQHNRIRSYRSVMDGMNFVMEDMARNIRLGSSVRCVTSSNGSVAPYDLGTFDVYPASCTGGSNKIVFNGVNHDPITYMISPVSPSPIYKQVDTGGNIGAPRVITPPEVTIDPTRSWFIVRHAEPIGQNDFGQPTVTILLAGTVTLKGVPAPFAIQTTVTLRQLDS